MLCIYVPDLSKIKTWKEPGSEPARESGQFLSYVLVLFPRIWEIDPRPEKTLVRLNFPIFYPEIIGVPK